MPLVGVCVLAAGLLAGPVLAATASPAPVRVVAPAPPGPRVAAAPPARWIAVSDATLWVKPGVDRTVDAPACAVPARPRAWIAGMTLAQKRWLVGRLETQALYGTKVYVLDTALGGTWTKVAVTGQPTPRNNWGYPGWVPTAQLTDAAPLPAPRLAVLRRATAWLWLTSALSGRDVELSYGTRLPAVAWSTTSVEVVLLDGRHLFLRRAAVVLRKPDVAWPPLTGPHLVTQARKFLGLNYLWAGTSGFGYDCSGFTHGVFRALGKTIPRDAAAQFARGTKIASRSSLHPGDLVFFRSSSGAIHHVGIYIGDGRMIHAPATGKPIQTTSLTREPYRNEFAGGRRIR